MDDYDVFNEMQNIKEKKVIMFVETDENFILKNFINSDFELLPIRFSYDLSNFSGHYIEQTKALFTYYYDQNNTYENEMLRLKKHFIHYQRFPFIAYIPLNKKYSDRLVSILKELKIECVHDKNLFLKKAKNERKLILIDSDDTIKRSNGNISKRTKKAILRNQMIGNVVVICTARPRYQTIDVMKESGAGNIIISSNGSEIYDVAKDKIINSSFIDNDEVNKLIECAYSRDIRLILTAGNYDYATKDIRNSNQLLLSKDDFINQLKNINIKQCMFIDTKIDEIYKLKEQLCQDKNISIVNEINENDPYEEKWFSVASASASKGNALEFLANYLAIPLKNTVAIGNDKNDISMFNSCGFSIAVNNAPDYIKKMVDYVTLSNDEDGVAIVLEGFIKNSDNK